MLNAFLEPLNVDDDVVRTLAFIVGERSGSFLKNFADALKRVLALGRSDVSATTILAAAKALVPRLAIGENRYSPASLFMSDEAGFVGALLNSDVPIRQASIAKMLGVSQSTISRYAQDYAARELPRESMANAQ